MTLSVSALEVTAAGVVLTLPQYVARTGESLSTPSRTVT